MGESDSDKRSEKDARIDPDFGPRHINNRKAARKLGWRYDPRGRVYRDSEGEMIADKFGQPLG